jgi:acetolactate decarboxylase
MKRTLAFAIVLCLLLSGCATRTENTVFQTSTIDALLAGVYDGDMSCRSLLKHGGFGIGTFDHLDGEMVLVDGNIYQVKADGKVYEPDLSTRTPFATVCHFNPEIRVPINPGSDYGAIEHLIDKYAPNQNLFCAIRITGQFAMMKTRSVPAQTKPYPPLQEVTSHQPQFHMENVSGIIVGFRCPAYVKGINVPGYHLHFISDDRTRGGHILAFEIVQGEGQIDILDNYFLTLPSDTRAFAETDLSKDRSIELKNVEK